MSGKIHEELGGYIRNKIVWQNIPIHIKNVMKNSQKDYERFVFNYSLKNQLRFRGNLVRKIFPNEQRYYELLIEKSITGFNLFPYHLADIVTKGLRVTPFNFYLDIISYLLKKDKSYDTLPNFTAADCYRVVGIGRNEYLQLIGEYKSNSSKLFRKANPAELLPRFPVHIHIEPWWKVEIGCVIETDIRYVNDAERSVIDDLIDFGSQSAGRLDFGVVHSLYRKGLIYLDVPVNGEDKISIPPLKNFIMNRVSGEHFENLLYKVFVTADESMNVSELSQMLQIDLDSIKHAVALICRLGFARKKTEPNSLNLHESWQRTEEQESRSRPQITPLNYHSLLMNATNDGLITDKSPLSPVSPQHSSPSSIGNTTIPRNNADFDVKPTSTTPTAGDNNSQDNVSSSDGGNTSEFSFANSLNGDSKLRIPESPNETMSELEDIVGDMSPNRAVDVKVTGKRVALLFDSTLTAFLMMGNLSPGLKNHAVTMFEVGKLCEESMETFLGELEKVSLLDAEGEGEVGRYFAHAVILRSTIITLRHVLNSGLDLIRLECLENLDRKTRDRLFDKKYKFIVAAAPLSGTLAHMFSIPFFGQFHKSSNNSHMWTKLFYNHISGYGPPSLFLTRGTVIKVLPRLFLGYGKLLVTIVQTDSYVINSANFRSINEQLKNGCVLIQGYGIKNSAELRYEAFPFVMNDTPKAKWVQHKALDKLIEYLNFENTCGFVTFVNTEVPDIGCDDYDVNVRLERAKPKRTVEKLDEPVKVPPPKVLNFLQPSLMPILLDLNSPLDSTEITSFNKNKTIINAAVENLKSPDEHYFSTTPQNRSPSNIYRSDDCNELLEKELDSLNEEQAMSGGRGLVSQSSIEIAIDDAQGQGAGVEGELEKSGAESEYLGEVWTLLDVHFGIPLFDVDCNTRICQYLTKNLCNEENLTKLTEVNEEMNKKFLKFVQQCMYFEDEMMDFVRPGSLLPQPRINLAFENGKICYWNGK